MPIGGITFNRSPRFAFPRSYLQRFIMPQVLLPQLSGGPNYVFAPAGSPGYTFYVTIRPAMWAWTTNNFTLDYFITDFYATLFPSPTLIPIPCYIDWIVPTTSDGSAIRLRFNGGEAPYFDGALPPRNVPYWLPDL